MGGYGYGCWIPEKNVLYVGFAELYAWSGYIFIAVYLPFCRSKQGH